MSECPAGCCPHDSAMMVAGCPGDLPGAPLPERAAHLRACQLMSIRKIAAVTGVDRQRITQLLYEVAIEDQAPWCLAADDTQGPRQASGLSRC